MSEFSIIYRMLRALRGALDSDEFPAELLSPDALGVSKPHLDSLWAMLANEV